MQLYPVIYSLVFIFFCSPVIAVPLSDDAYLKISNFRQGLIEFNTLDQPQIYKQGNQFTYAINGTCISAQKEHPCIWYGFEFSFKSPEEITVFECTTTSDRPQNQSYPHAIVARSTKLFHWGFTVYGHSGYYIRPQYTIEVKDRPLHMAFSCSNKGIEVLTWELTLTPPDPIAPDQNQHQVATP